MAVEMDCKGPWGGVAEFRRDLVPDAFALVDRHTLCLAPGPRHLVQLLFLRRRRRDHVVDEQNETLWTRHLLDAELLARLLEEHVRVTRKVVGDDEVWLGEDVVTGLHAHATRGTGKDLFGHRLWHGKPVFFHNVDFDCAATLELHRQFSVRWPAQNPRKCHIVDRTDRPGLGWQGTSIPGRRHALSNRDAEHRARRRDVARGRFARASRNAHRRHRNHQRASDVDLLSNAAAARDGRTGHP